MTKSVSTESERALIVHLWHLHNEAYITPQPTKKAQEFAKVRLLGAAEAAHAVGVGMTPTDVLFALTEVRRSDIPPLPTPLQSRTIAQAMREKHLDAVVRRFREVITVSSATA